MGKLLRSVPRRHTNAPSNQRLQRFASVADRAATSIDPEHVSLGAIPFSRNPSGHRLDSIVEKSDKDFHLYTKSHIPSILKRYAAHLDVSLYRAAAEVFPMRVNNYVLNNHINWSNVPNDPIFQLTFPQPAMLPQDDLQALVENIRSKSTSRVQLRAQAESIRARLNPYPAGQKDENVPVIDGSSVPGMQHKYRETVLFFPMEFTSVGSPQQFQSKSTTGLREYLSLHPQVTDVLFTGGDPVVMTSDNLHKYIDPILGCKTLNTIRIGTKSLAFWPHRYTSSSDALATLQLFSSIVAAGKHLTIQAHFSHPRELATPAVGEAIRLIRMTGANIRCQSPLIRHVNENPQVWADMWSIQTRLGCIPYYMFVERDTGASHYFSVPLDRAYNIFSAAYSTLSGVARTVRGPSMSASPGKVGIVGVEEILGQKVFLLKFFQARNPSWTDKIFFAKHDPKAVWLSDLKPAFGRDEFFYEKEYQAIVAGNVNGSSGQRNYDE